MGDRLAGGIEPLRLGLDHQTRQRGAVLLELGDDVEGGIAKDQRRLIARLQVALDDVGDPRAVERDVAGDPGQDGPEGVGGLSEQLDRVAGHVLGDDPPFRSRIVPRGEVSGIGRSRLVSALSWNLSCCRTWVRKKAPLRTRKAPSSTSRAMSARSRMR